MWILYLCTGFTSELCMEVQYSLGNLVWGHHNSGIPDSPWHRTDSFPALSHVTGNKTNYVLAILIQVQFTFYNCMPCYLLCMALRQRAHFWLLPSWCHTSRSVLYHTALIYTWHHKLTFSFHCSLVHSAQHNEYGGGGSLPRSQGFPASNFWSLAVCKNNR